MFRLSMITVLAVFSLANPVFAQSKDETKQFLIEKCKLQVSNLGVGGGTSFHEVFFEKGETIVQRTKFRASDLSWDRDYRVSLKELNPKRVKVEKLEASGPFPAIYFVTAEVTGKKSKVIRHLKIYTKPTEEKTERTCDICIEGCDERDARQIAKALTHLIKECGGKPELFDDD